MKLIGYESISVYNIKSNIMLFNIKSSIKKNYNHRIIYNNNNKKTKVFLKKSCYKRLFYLNHIIVANYIKQFAEKDVLDLHFSISLTIGFIIILFILNKFFSTVLTIFFFKYENNFTE
jgi:hypothetical protein